jgi:pimeloyl-ACP methyl ester carboxylesterase
MSSRESSFLSSNGHQKHRIVYSDWGPEDGFPVIGIHGLTGNGRDFDWLAPDLASHGFRVIAVDMPGRGRSDFLPDTADYNFAQYIQDLTGLLEHLGLNKPGSVDWIGISMGGLLGITLAGMKNSPIRKIVLNDIGPTVPQKDLNIIVQYISQTYEFDTIDAMAAFMKQTRGLSWGTLTDGQWRQMAENNARPLENGKITYSFDPGIADVFAVEPVGAVDLWSCWDAMGCPALILRGSESTIFPQAVAEEMIERGPGARGKARLEIIQGCGHVPSLMVPDQIALVRGWLKA